MIDQNTVQRVLDATDIVDVVKEFVTLRKSGANYKGLCPFHNEKTPSFTVSPAKQMCKCFSCGKGGTAVGFLMELEQMTFPEAIKWLGRRVGIEVEDKAMTDEERARQSVRESMFALNQWASEYFQNALRNDVEGVAKGLAYFRSRGVRDDMIERFHLGYAPEAQAGIAQAALAHGFSEEYLLKTGICYRRDDGRLENRYHGRVIFPVHTVSGKVVAFGGRILSSDKKLAKYVNSPESEIYSKSNELYGLYQAKTAIVRKGHCFLVEGYTDVISMHQSGIENVVASSGTSLTEGQIRLLHRFTNHITVLYDGDAAGIKASLRGIDMLLAEGLNVKVLLLPDGEDPDSFSRHHKPQEVQDYIDQHQVDFIKFKTDLLLGDVQGDPLKRAELISNVVRSIALIPNEIVRQTYIQECAMSLEVSEALIVNEINKEHRQKVQEQQKKASGEQSENRSEEGKSPTPLLLSSQQASSEEELLISMVIRHGGKPMKVANDEENDEEQIVSVAQYIDEDLKADDISLAHPVCRQILSEAVAHAEEKDWNSLSYFSQHENPEVSTLAARMGQERYTLSERHQAEYVDEQYRLEEIVPRLLHDFKYALIRQRLKQLLADMKQPEVVHAPERYNKLLQEYMELTKVERMFASVLGDRVVLK